MGFDPFYGRKLGEDIRSKVSSTEKTEIEEKEIHRPVGNHYEEMLIRARELLSVSRKFNNVETARIFEEVISEIDTDEKRQKLPPFRTPDAKAVIVRFHQ